MKKILFYIIIFSISFSQTRDTPESAVYKQCKNKVFKVFGSGHGSGFLINNKGLILTNDHVIGRNTHNINVQINDSIKVRAKLVARDRDKDLATVVINPKVVKSLKLNRFDFPSQNTEMIIEGEKVVAIGSPLDQDKIITSGIVSSFTDKVIMHDVNINPGNSGGPLINMNSEVIGVNSFGNHGRIGPGIYGSVNISEAYNIINKSMSVLNKMDIQNISTRLLPITPTEIFPLYALRESIDKYYPESVYNLNAEKFKINFSTPPREYHEDHIESKRLASKRESGENISHDYEKDIILYEWMGSTGEFLPYVAMIVSPVIGQTANSQCSNSAGAFAAGYSGSSYYGRYEYEFKSDVKKVSIFRGDKEIVPYQTSYRMVESVASGYTYRYSYSIEDMAQKAIIRLPIDLFLPRNGKFEQISVEILDYKSNKIIRYTIPKNTVYKINDDFSPYTGDKLGTKLYRDPRGSCS